MVNASPIRASVAVAVGVAVAASVSMTACAHAPAPQPRSQGPQVTVSATPAPSTGSCQAWATSITPDAHGAVSLEAAVADHLRTHPELPDVPAAKWLPDVDWFTEPGPGAVVVVRAGASSLEVTRLPDESWLVTAGETC